MKVNNLKSWHSLLRDWKMSVSDTSFMASSILLQLMHGLKKKSTAGRISLITFSLNSDAANIFSFSAMAFIFPDRCFYTLDQQSAPNNSLKIFLSSDVIKPDFDTSFHISNRIVQF